jgi:hypothetical protein
VVFEVEHRRGLKPVAIGGRLAVGQQHGHWFISATRGLARRARHLPSPIDTGCGS